MKTLIVYFSLGGTTAKAAEIMKPVLDADILEIKLLKEKRSGPGTFLWAVFQSMRNKKPALKPFTVDFEKYGLIVLGAPVWASCPAAPIVSFLSRAAITGKKVALFCCYERSPKTVFEKMKAFVPGNTIVSERGFNFSAESPEARASKEKVEEWARTLL